MLPNGVSHSKLEPEIKQRKLQKVRKIIPLKQRMQNLSLKGCPYYLHLGKMKTNNLFLRKTIQPIVTALKEPRTSEFIRNMENANAKYLIHRV